MKNVFKLLPVILVLFFSSHALAAPKALVYNGAGVCQEGCAIAAYNSAVAAGFDPVYVGDHENDAAIFNGASVWVQPGGNSSLEMNSMSTELKNNLKNFIKNGGGYVGFCAGAFVATSIVGSTKVRGLGIIPGNTKLYGTGVQMLKTKWLGSDRYIYWEGGPYFRNMPSDIEQTGEYSNGLSAAVRTTFGKGRVWVTGLHPEAPQAWKDYVGVNDIDGDDLDLVANMLQWVTEAH